MVPEGQRGARSQGDDRGIVALKETYVPLPFLATVYQMRINPALAHLTAGRTKSDQMETVFENPYVSGLHAYQPKEYVFKDQHSFKLKKQVQGSQLVTCPQSLDHVLSVCEPSWTRLPSRETPVLPRGLQWSRRACLPSTGQDAPAPASH